MNKLEMPTMEEAILQEEQVSLPEINQTEKDKPKTKDETTLLKKKFLMIIKSTKLITIFILFIIFILILIGILIYSSKKETSSDIQSDTVIATPLPQNKVTDPQLKAVEDRLDEYDTKVDSLGSNLNNYQPPQIDLNINF